mgnify:CR=1 FL=1
MTLYRVRFLNQDEKLDTTIECSSNKSILESAEDLNIDLPFSCRAGACSSCVGKLIKGDDILSPRIDAFVDGEAGNEVLTKVQKRLRHFMDRKINSAFEPLLAMRDDELVNGMARGLAFRLVESLGVIPRSVVAKDVKELDQDGRGLLRKHVVRFVFQAEDGIRDSPE